MLASPNTTHGCCWTWVGVGRDFFFFVFLNVLKYGIRYHIAMEIGNIQKLKINIFVFEKKKTTKFESAPFFGMSCLVKQTIY